MTQQVHVVGRSLILALVIALLPSLAASQSLPAPWSSTDVGAPAVSGSAALAQETFTITAGGLDIWGSSDQFHFVYQPVVGDAQITARIEGIVQTDVWAKAGVMIRRSLEADAPHGYALVSAANGISFQRRITTGGLSTSTPAVMVAAPAWVRAVRAGSVVRTYWSADNVTWKLIGEDTIGLDATAYFGVAVTSHNAGTPTTAAVSNVTIVRQGLPDGQAAGDIGKPAVIGSTKYSSGTYTIRAGGRDVWDTADQFHFVYQQVTGDAEIVARVASIQMSNAWAKAGVMLRESLTAQSRHASMFVSAAKGYAFQRRPETGAYSASTGAPGAPPGWVRLVRTGDLIQAYQSADGSNWTLVGSDTVPMGETIYVGLAVTSHSTSRSTTAIIDNLRLSATTATGNQPPAVSILAPANAAQFTAGDTVAIGATATDPEQRMAAVAFYADSTLVGTDSTAPYSFSWIPTTAGTYSLTAVASDADGGTTTSGAISVIVNGPNAAPSATLTAPATGSSYTAPATIGLAANASDPEGQLSAVEFYNGATLLGSDTTAPYSFSWTNVPAGTYSLTARAFDADGMSTTSTAATITVTAPPSTAPRLVVFSASSDHAINVTNYTFEVFTADANPSTATPIASANLGKPAPDASNDITSDQSALFSNLALGNYIATVTAIGPGGATRSAPVAFTR